MEYFNSHHASSSIVRLNIGGKKFCTTTDTLTQREPESMLAAMFSGRHTLCQDSPEGYVFLDRDGKHFRHILNWLRDGVVPILKDYRYAELLHEAEYFQLLGLIDAIKASLRKEDERLCSTYITRADVIRCIQSSTNSLRFRGVNLSGLDLSKLDLSKGDFSYACLRNVLLSHANLQGAEFTGADLSKANLEGANLSRAILQADLTNANLEGAILCQADLRGSKLTGAVMKDANLTLALLTREDFPDIADLTGANLLGIHLYRK